MEKEKEFNTLEIAKTHQGYFCLFHYEGLTYTYTTQDNFTSFWDCFEAAKRNDLVKSSDKPIRILATSGIIQWIEEYGRLKSEMPGVDFVSVSLQKCDGG